MTEVKRKDYRGTRPKTKMPSLDDLKAIGPIEPMEPRNRQDMLKRDDHGHFEVGNTGSRLGRASNMRRELAKNFARALAEDFEQFGADAIQQCRLIDPSAYVKVCASLLPKETIISDERQMTDEQLHASIKRLLDKKMINELFGEDEQVTDSDGKPVDDGAIADFDPSGRPN
jgi:hypothetical protein